MKKNCSAFPIKNLDACVKLFGSDSDEKTYRYGFSWNNIQIFHL